jgi:uncharacterized membrane protein
VRELWEEPMAIELGVFVFHGRHVAKQVLKEVREENYAWIEDVAVIERNKRGRLTVHSTWAQNEDDRKGIKLGAATGALVGALLGPAGIVAGAIVGGTGGGLVGAGIDIAEYDPRLADVGKSLEPDTSALMLWAEPTNVEAFVATFRVHGAKLIRSSLSDKQARKLRAALRPDQQV